MQSYVQKNQFVGLTHSTLFIEVIVCRILNGNDRRHVLTGLGRGSRSSIYTINTLVVTYRAVDGREIKPLNGTIVTLFGV